MQKVEVGLTVTVDGVPSGGVTVEIKGNLPGTDFEVDVESLFDSVFYWAKNRLWDGVHVTIWKEG